MSEEQTIKPARRIPQWVWIIVLILILAIIAVMIVGYINKQKERESLLVPPVVDVQIPVGQIYNFVGEVSNIDGNSLYIAVSPTNNQGLAEAKTIRVTVLDTTALMRVSSPKQIDPENPPANLINRNSLSFEDIKVGDMVTVTSDKDINLVSGLNAGRVTLQSVE